jgi:peptide/nickel transport system permease protein
MKLSHVIIGFICIIVVLPLICMFVGGRLLDPFGIDPTLAFAAPGEDALAGRDKLGRDYLARVLLGAGESVLAAGLAAITALVIAVTVGVVAGWRADSPADAVLGYFKSLLFTMPFFLIAVAVGTVLQAGLFAIYVIVGLMMWAPAARIARAETVRVRSAPSAIAARAYGFTPFQRFRRVFLPQVTLAPAVSILYLLPELLGLDVGLSFFGLGSTPPNPTLGRLVFEGIASFPAAWWLVALPGTVLVLICITCYALLHTLPATRT